MMSLLAWGRHQQSTLSGLSCCAASVSSEISAMGRTEFVDDARLLMNVVQAVSRPLSAYGGMPLPTASGADAAARHRMDQRIADALAILRGLDPHRAGLRRRTQAGRTVVCDVANHLSSAHHTTLRAITVLDESGANRERVEGSRDQAAWNVEGDDMRTRPCRRSGSRSDGNNEIRRRGGADQRRSDLFSPGCRCECRRPRTASEPMCDVPRTCPSNGRFP